MMVNSSNVNQINLAIKNNLSSGSFLPSVYVVEPISRCNLQCGMCPNRKMEAKNLGDIDVALFERIIRSISPYAEFLMLYWMGEPLLHNEIIQILKIAKRYIKGKIVLSTNMTEINDEVLLSMLENCDIILCCIDRWEEKAYERIRKGADFKKVIKNTERLLSLKSSLDHSEVIVKAIDISMKEEEYLSFKEYWESKGASTLLAWLGNWAGTFKNIKKVATLPIPNEGKQRNKCCDLWFKMVINWKGEVQICCFDWQYSHTIGKVSNENWIKKIWQSDQIISLRKKHINHQYDSISICENCDSWAEPNEHDAYVNFSKDSYFTVF